jgi:hypothetical protein
MPAVAFSHLVALLVFALLYARCWWLSFAITAAMACGAWLLFWLRARRVHERELAEGFQYLVHISEGRPISERDILRAFSPHDRRDRRAALRHAHHRRQARRPRQMAR